MEECRNYVTSSVSLSECIGRSGSGTTRHTFMHTIRSTQRFLALSQLKWHALPTRQRRLVEAWAELHQQELLIDWERLQSGQPTLPIEPLK